MNASTASLNIRGPNARKNNDIKKGNSSCETVELSKYLGTVLTFWHQNLTFKF
jgi:hypothetical protein